MLLRDSLLFSDGIFFGSNEGMKLLCTNGKVIGTIVGNVDGTKLGRDVGTVLGSLDGSFDGSTDVNLEGLLLGDALICPDGNVIGSDIFTKIDFLILKCLELCSVNKYGITLALDVGIELFSFYGSFDCSNDGKLVGLFLRDSLEYSLSKLL